MSIAALSTLISSIALVGVAISLILQARQLRVNQVQIARASQVELLKLGLNNPVAASELVGAADPDGFARGVFLNWYVGHLLTSYETGATSKSNIERLARELFAVEASRKWWAMARQSYANDARSRRQKSFFAVVDGEFQRAGQTSESAMTAVGELHQHGDSPPPPPS
jgi:hypothetical protein